MSSPILPAREVEEVVTANEEVTDIIVQRVPYWDPPAVRALDTSELTTWSLYRALIGEFTASLILLYVSIATVIGYKNQSSAADERCTGVGYLGVAWSFGATVSVLVYSTSGVSGTHTYSITDLLSPPVMRKLLRRLIIAPRPVMQVGT